jgi:ribosomal protein L11 methyltransferase
VSESQPNAEGVESGAGAWLELAVEADVEAVEMVSEILARVAPGGVTVEPAFVLLDEGLAAQVDPAQPAVVRAYVPARDPASSEAAVATADGALGRLRAFDLRPIGPLRTRVVHEADWAEAWKKHFPVLRVGRRLVIRPTWRRHRSAGDEVVIKLDPGMAFGTGLHPTTRLCLVALERVADGRGIRSRTLDVGCGSGILAIAAALLGAGRVTAIDTDPIAIESTLANAARNALGDRIAVRRESVPTGDPAYEVVLANLVASILVDLAPALAGEVAPGGTLIASGIFADREAEVRTAFEAAGLILSGRDVEGDWVALTCRRIEPSAGPGRWPARYDRES